MKTIVITGSTRGIGFGLADAFLARGCAVTLSGRSQGSVDAALAQLSAIYDAARLCGQPCDVTQPDQVDALWGAAVDKFGGVDVWINNAGVGQDYMMVWDLPYAQVRAVIDTNLLGAINGCRTAVTRMQRQGHGAIYNMEGFGSGGRVRPGLSVYAASKAAVRSLSRSLVAESKDLPVIVGTLSPGMVVTDLLLDPIKDDPQALKQVKKIINILGERVETVAPWLADRVLANDKSGAEIAWLTRRKILWRFITASFHKRDIFAEADNPDIPASRDG